MDNMTYRQLLARLKSFTPEQLGLDVTVKINGEFFAAQAVVTVNEGDDDSDVLDPPYPVISVIK